MSNSSKAGQGKLIAHRSLRPKVGEYDLFSHDQAFVKIISGNCPAPAEVPFELVFSLKQNFTPLHVLLDVPPSPYHDVLPCMTAVMVYSWPADSWIG